MKVYEVTKKPVPAERNPVAAFAQRSGAGIHKDQNKKNKPLRKVKHKKKDFTTENKLVEEIFNKAEMNKILAENQIVKWIASKFGSAVLNSIKWVGRWMVKNPGKTVIGGGLAYIGSYFYDAAEWLMNNWGPLKEYGKFGLTISVIAAILFGGKKLWDALSSKNPDEVSSEELATMLKGQAATTEGVTSVGKIKKPDQARGNEPMPKAQPGRTKHPLKGRLVGSMYES